VYFAVEQLTESIFRDYYRLCDYSALA